MREHALAKLEYQRIIDIVASYTVTYMGRRLAEKLRPLTEKTVAANRLKETDEARRLMEKSTHVPLPSLDGMEEILTLLGTGYSDVVRIPALDRTGVIYKQPDERDNLVVQVQGVKMTMNRKRVRLFIESKHLYPADYDLDIVFDSVENRKKRKLMSKRHVEGLTIETKPDED